MNENVDVQVKGCEIAIPGAAAASSAHGKLPQIELPGDGRSMIDFVRELAAALKDKGLYRRDKILVHVYETRLAIMDGATFVTWAERHVSFYKKRWDEDAGSYFNVVRSMPGSVSDHAISSVDLWGQTLEIVTVNFVQKPVRRTDGSMAVPPVGYDKESKTLTFKP
ncbi:MAG: hypothetical protein ACOYMV_10055 [Verrucomicrobiia bacterium]